MAALLIAGVVAADVVTYTLLRSSLYGRLDEQLDVAQRQADVYLLEAQAQHRVPTQAGLDARVSPDVYVLVLGPRGHVVARRPSSSSPPYDPAPKLPAALRVAEAPSRGRFGAHHGAYVPEPDRIDVPAQADSGIQYRLSALAVPQGTLFTAISLLPTNETLVSLLRVEVAASAAAIVVLCALALWTIRRGLRPLEAMAATADAISSGDLTRRVPAASSSSEVDRLGVALNAMLAQIEAAFAEKSDSEERLRRFVADASHELRTPLTSIRGYTELLRKGAFVEEEGRQRALERVESEASRMGGLVNDLLLLARLDQGRPLEALPVDLRRISADAVDDARAVDPSRRIELAAAEPVVVVGDHDRLHQAVHNLVGNALAHTPSTAPVRVEVTAEGAIGVVRVIDRGPGIDPAEATLVFERFYRGDKARSRAGTGLGLAIVRSIAEASKGSASVVSVPGETTFALRLPLAAGSAPQQGAGAGPERIEDGLELERGLLELGGRVRAGDDAGAGGQAGGRPVHHGAADADHEVPVAGGVDPADRTGPLMAGRRLK
jgi:two-component system OmpR family sensor kinase